MKQILTILLLLTFSVSYAQMPSKGDNKDNKAQFQKEGMKGKQGFNPWFDNKKFSPEEFMKRENKFITREAKLTEAEAAFVCPLVHQMNAEIRKIDHQIHVISFSSIKEEKSDAECKKAMEQINNLQTEKIDIAKSYQKKMLKELSASKVIHILNANQRFGRYMLRQMMQNWTPQFKKQGEKKGENGKD